jgi:apolipoprotein N-acyltransferase
MGGGLLAMGLPPLGFWWVAWIGMFALYGVLHGASHRQTFSRVYVFAVAYFLVAYHWIGFAFLVDAETNLWLMPFAVGGLAGFMALYWALAIFGLGFIARLPLLAQMVLGIALAEWVRGILFTGFPWAAPGLIAEAMGPVAQLASIIGMPGLTAVVLAWMAMPLVLCQWPRRRGVAALREAWPGLVLVASLPVVAVWGAFRLASLPLDAVDGVKLRLVQPNIAQSDKWRADNAEAVFTQLLAQSADGADAGGITHVVWPESALAFLLDESPNALRRIGAALGPSRQLLTGAIRRERRTDGTEPYFTSVMLINGAGRVTDHYDKWRLVPGGEYLPFEDLFARFNVRKLVTLPESFTAGPGPANMLVPGLGPVGLAICYEAIFPHQFVAAQRPNLIVNVTNDGWFGRSVGPGQHFAQVRLRAIEQGLPIARSANTGISGMIDGAGRTWIRSELEMRGVFDISVPKPLSATLFATFGQWMVALALALVAALLTLLEKNRQRSKVNFNQ